MKINETFQQRFLANYTVNFVHLFFLFDDNFAHFSNIFESQIKICFFILHLSSEIKFWLSNDIGLKLAMDRKLKTASPDFFAYYILVAFVPTDNGYRVPPVPLHTCSPIHCPKKTRQRRVFPRYPILISEP